jgi:hypothetical protein
MRETVMRLVRKFLVWLRWVIENYGAGDDDFGM